MLILEGPRHWLGYINTNSFFICNQTLETRGLTPLSLQLFGLAYFKVVQGWDTQCQRPCWLLLRWRANSPDDAAPVINWSHARVRVTRGKDSTRGASFIPRGGYWGEGRLWKSMRCWIILVSTLFAMWFMQARQLSHSLGNFHASTTSCLLFTFFSFCPRQSFDSLTTLRDFMSRLIIK